MTQRSSSSTSTSYASRTYPPPSRRPNPSPNCRMCPPWSYRRASTFSPCRQNKRPANSSTRSPSKSSPGVVGSIRPQISIKSGHRSWPCLTSIEDLSTFERAESLRLDRHSKRAQQLYPVGPMLDEVTGLQTYDRHAREVAQRANNHRRAVFDEAGRRLNDTPRPPPANVVPDGEPLATEPFSKRSREDSEHGHWHHRDEQGHAASLFERRQVSLFGRE